MPKGERRESYLIWVFITPSSYCPHAVCLLEVMGWAGQPPPCSASGISCTPFFKFLHLAMMILVIIYKILNFLRSNYLKDFLLISCVISDPCNEHFRYLSQGCTSWKFGIRHTHMRSFGIDITKHIPSFRVKYKMFLHLGFSFTAGPRIYCNTVC